MVDADALRNARKQLTVHVGLLLGMFALHTIAAAWLVLVRFDLAFDPLAAARWPLARGLFEAWLFAGVLWAPINARGLLKRRPWARRSTAWYWAASIPICCCIPIPIWALWSMTRPAMVKLLDEA